MAGRLERLMLTVGLLDRITGPLRGIQRTVDQVTNHSRRAFMNTAAGVTALIAASSSFAATINPANDMNNALGEVRSLAVADDTLAQLNAAGLRYSIQFGEQASNYVRSAYDIQSAIDGLSGNDLPRFTTAAGTLAKATKANVSDISSYFGSMYGIFRGQANEMGKARWVEMLAGQTATAVQMFKTTGPEMSSAFESIGAEAQTMGVKLNEQMAILGNLQATMSGSEAGTKYRAFLAGLAGAEQKLGLKFSDESGTLLPIVDILNTIEGKFGSIDTLAEGDVLKKAFGSQEATAFLKLMSSDINKLQGDINALGNVSGMEKAVWMAEQMNDPWARGAAGIQAVTIAIWQKALPAIEPYVNMLRDATLVIVDWTEKYPHLAKAVGLGVTAMMAMIAVGGILTLMIGLARFSFVGLIGIQKLGLPLLWAWRGALLAKAGAMWLARTAMLAWILNGPGLINMFRMMKAGILSAIPAIWSFTAAMLANPITWIVVGIVALIGAIVALIYYWDEIAAAVSAGWDWLKRLFADNEWLKVAFFPLYAAMGVVDAVIEVFKRLPAWWDGFTNWLSALSLSPNWDISTDIFEPVLAWWQGFTDWLSGLNPFSGMDSNALSVLDLVANGWASLKQLFAENEWLKVAFFPLYAAIGMVDAVIEAFKRLPEWWANFKTWLRDLDPFSFLGDKIDWLRNKLSWLPGLEVDAATEVTQRIESEQQTINEMVALPGADSGTGSESGGLMQSISNWWGGSQKSTHVDKIEVNNHGQPMRGDQLAYELEMAAG